MIPAVFVSSTVVDLHHIRDVVRSTIEEIGYRPVMSEFSEIGALAHASAEDACYRAVSECQFVVLIIGRRCGTNSKAMADATVTEMEYMTACRSTNRIRVLTLVEADVLTYERMYDLNTKSGSKKIECPDMDNPGRTFAFLKRIRESSNGNWIFTFNDASDIRNIIKIQFASLFYDHLIGGVSSKDKLDEILGAVQALKVQWASGGKEQQNLLTVTSFLLEERCRNFAAFLKWVGPFERTVGHMIKVRSLDALLKTLKVNYSVTEARTKEDSPFPKFLKEEGVINNHIFSIRDNTQEGLVRIFGVVGRKKDGSVILDKVAWKSFSDLFEDLVKKFIA